MHQLDLSFKIIEFSTELAPKFKEINKEWITKMFHLEPKDERVLDDPKSAIIDGGGHILFVEILGVGIVGACALLKTSEDQYELTKMGVLETARGTGAGKYLLQAIVEKAKSIGAKRLYLLTNKKCESAIHIYQSIGFKHDQSIIDEFGNEYARCDVGMNYDNLK